MQSELRAEVDQNYDYFQRNLVRFKQDHEGQYALIKSASVIGFFDGSGNAFREGLARFPDRVFSVQLVTDVPDEIGLMSVGIA